MLLLFLFRPSPSKGMVREDAEENRLAASQLIQNREMRGYLAYNDGRIVGWCNANPVTATRVLTTN